MRKTRNAVVAALGIFLALALVATDGATPETAEAASCTGANACVGNTGNIGENACNGDNACFQNTADIPDNACNGLNACYQGAENGGDATIGEGSCTGQNACYRIAAEGGTATIGEDSCVGLNACYYIAQGSGDSTVGDDSCRGENACYYMGVNTGVAVVGDLSCYGKNACYYNGYDGESHIGDGSCYEENSCYYSGVTGKSTIGMQACHGVDACYYNGQAGNGTIGDFSCQGSDACYYNGQSGVSIIGEASCRANGACYYAGQAGNSAIGHLSCNDTDACQQNEGTIGVCEENDDIFACVIIRKTVVSGPLHVAFDFTGSFDPFELMDGEAQYVLSSAGTRDVEELPPTGWEVTIECEGSPYTAQGSTVTLQLVAGPLTECTFFNRFVPEAENNRPPNIGAGLSGLFAGQPTPLPSARPATTAPAAVAPTISPPRTGDGGLAR